MTMRFALAGNPNCGKTTMFNAMTGATITSQAVTDAVNDAIAQYYAVKEAE